MQQNTFLHSFFPLGYLSVCMKSNIIKKTLEKTIIHAFFPLGYTNLRVIFLIKLTPHPELTAYFHRFKRKT